MPWQVCIHPYPHCMIQLITCSSLIPLPVDIQQFISLFKLLSCLRYACNLRWLTELVLCKKGRPHGSHVHHQYVRNCSFGSVTGCQPEVRHLASLDPTSPSSEIPSSTVTLSVASLEKLHHSFPAVYSCVSLAVLAIRETCVSLLAKGRQPGHAARDSNMATASAQQARGVLVCLPRQVCPDQRMQLGFL